MPGYVRRRWKDYGHHEGYYYPIGDESNHTVRSASRGGAFCEDVVGNFEGVNPLEITRLYRTPGLITGKEAVWPVYGFVDYPYDNQPPSDYATATHVDGWDAGIVDAVTATTKVAAWTSPGRADISIPLFLYELRELPEMIFKSKDRILRENAKRRSSRTGEVDNTGNSVAEYNFGWDLLYKDVSKLLQFSSQVEKRKKELKAIYDRPHGLKRQRVVWSNSARHVEYVAAHSWIAGLGVNRTFNTSARRWASITWKPFFDFQVRPSDEEIANKAIASVHGWRASPATVWQGLPWSWFADYFGNVGDVLTAIDNTFEYKLDKSCVMTHIRTLITDEVVVADPSFTFRPATVIFEQKFRTPSTIGFRVNSPFLSGKQLATLAGIAANYKG